MIITGIGGVSHFCLGGHLPVDHELWFFFLHTVYTIFSTFSIIYSLYMKSSFPKRYKSILIVFMKMTFFYLDPYILLIFNLSCQNGLLAQSEHVKNNDCPTPPRVRSITPSGSRTRVSGAGGACSNKERQRLQPLASVARAPLCEVRRVRYILNKEI